MRDTELYQTLLGLTPSWEVTAVNITQSSADRPLGEVAVEVDWRAPAALVCPSCGQTAPRYDARRRRHLNTMQWKTFITADVPRVACPSCGVKQVRVAWAEDSSRFTELFEAYAVQVLQAVRSKVQAQGTTGDPARNATFVLFADPNYFITDYPASTCKTCVNPAYAWNHGDIQPEIAQTWLGFVGPGVRQMGASDIWTDHTDVRPTKLTLLGLQDDYVHDGRGR